MKFGHKFDSQTVSTKFYSNGFIEVVSCKATLYSFQINQIKFLERYLSKNDEDCSGFELYFKSKTILFRNQKIEIVNNWISHITNLIKPDIYERNVILNLYRKTNGIKEKWAPCTITANPWRYSVFTDTDCTKFKFTFSMFCISKVEIKFETTMNQFLLLVYLEDGKVLNYSHPSEEGILPLFVFFASLGITCLQY